MDNYFSLQFFHNYFALTLVFLFFAYLVSITSYYIVHKKIKFSNFRFSYRNYYIMMTPFLIPAFLFSVFEKNFIYLYLFLFFSFLGVGGEILFSVLWKQYFKKPFWRYNFSNIANGFSSFLNFIPWGFGGFLFLFIERFYSFYIGYTIDFNISTKALLFSFMQITLLLFVFSSFFKIVGKNLVLHFFKRGRVKRKNVRIGLKYVYFVMPFFLAGFLLPMKYLDYLKLFILFGVITFLAEYLFGKMSKLIIGKKLWKYDYLTIDNKHTSLLNIFPFGFAGYYFFLIFLIINSIVRM